MPGNRAALPRRVGCGLVAAPFRKRGETMQPSLGEQLLTGSITLVVGMTVVFLVLGILYGMLLLIPLVNKKE